MGRRVTPGSGQQPNPAPFSSHEFASMVSAKDNDDQKSFSPAWHRWRRSKSRGSIEWRVLATSTRMSWLSLMRTVALRNALCLDFNRSRPLDSIAAQLDGVTYPSG